MKKSAAVILAAGKSTRMKSDLPKVLHEICGAPMLAFVIDACVEAGVDRVFVVVGYRKDAVVARFAGRRDLAWVEQAEQNGTAHAVLCCEDALREHTGPVLVVAGDMPLVRPATLRRLLEELARSGDAMTLATTILEDPTGYGRIVRDEDNRLVGIVEHHDCGEGQLKIREVNPSYYCFDGRCLFDALHKISPDNRKGEYYITDAIGVLRSQGLGAGAIAAVPPDDAMGINSRMDLAVVGGVMQKRIQQAWMSRGVTLVDPSSTWINAGAEIGEDTVILPFSFVDGGTRIGAGCRIGPFGCVMRGDQVAAGKSIGPCAAAERVQP